MFNSPIGALWASSVLAATNDAVATNNSSRSTILVHRQLPTVSRHSLEAVKLDDIPLDIP